jgi:hypothetical protein
VILRTLPMSYRKAANDPNRIDHQGDLHKLKYTANCRLFVGVRRDRRLREHSAVIATTTMRAAARILRCAVMSVAMHKPGKSCSPQRH